jgi:hypothetical protein
MFLQRRDAGKRYGFVTPGEMLSTYFQGDAIRMLSWRGALFLDPLCRRAARRRATSSTC